MAPSPLRKQHITVIHPISSFVEKDWTPAKLEKWIKSAGGTTSSHMTAQTTHLVVSIEQWRQQSEIVQEALARNLNSSKTKGVKEVKIVSEDWLIEELQDQKKVKESAFLWSKIEPLSSSEGCKKTVLEERSRNGALNPSVMADLLSKSTESYVDPKEQKKLDRQIREQERLKREAEQEKENEARKRKEEVRKVVQESRKKANRALFSENWHIYVDVTGFAYDIVLTKVEVASNTNEKVNITLKIQIYESNEHPYTYAVNLDHSRTSKFMANKLLASMGSNFQTAMRTFKDAFSEQTGGVDWDFRLSHAEKRSREERLSRDQHRVQGSKSRCGLPNKEQWFRYDPPLYGPRGTLTGSEKESFPEIGPRDRGFEAGKNSETRSNVALWRSSGNPQIVPEKQHMMRGSVLGEAAGVDEGRMVRVENGSPAPAPAAPVRLMTAQEVLAQATKEDEMADLDFALNNYGNGLGDQGFAYSAAGTSSHMHNTTEPGAGEIAFESDNTEFTAVDHTNVSFNSFMDNFVTDLGVNDQPSNDISPSKGSFNLGSSLLGKRKASTENVSENAGTVLLNKRRVIPSADQGQAADDAELRAFEHIIDSSGS